MTDNRGRHNKNNAPKAGSVKFPKARPLTAKGEVLRVQWERMTIEQKSAWNYRFDNYRNAYEPEGVK